MCRVLNESEKDEFRTSTSQTLSEARVEVSESDNILHKIIKKSIKSCFLFLLRTIIYMSKNKERI